MTHVSALASRINREQSPPASYKSRGSTLSKLANTRSQEDARQDTSGRQMLTASEVAERRKARKALEYKRAALEEAAERRVCELVYGSIWRHKSTLDEVRDEKLRSKTAALLLLGIDLKDLGVDIDLSTIDEQRQQEANVCLSQARDYLAKMNDYNYPLGKLQQLAAAHKAIVDALTKLLPSSSSADEILPTLIYSLITCPPEGVNVISNLLFIQRFRSSNKIDGETAYCLTNLEAAISFLENVELSTLRADDLQDGPPKTASEAISSPGQVDSFPRSKEITPLPVTTVSASAEIAKPEANKPVSSTLPRPHPYSSPQQRRLSNLFQPPTKILEAANDAVRSSADQSLKNISASLDNSFNFLFGRLKELQGQVPHGDGAVVPRTLAEARHLVAAPPANTLTIAQNDIISISSVPSDDEAQTGSSQKTTEFSSGGRTPRDRSTNSARMQANNRTTVPATPRDQLSQSPSNPIGPTPLESMRNFGNTLNPLNHIPGMIKNFGRSTPGTHSARSISPAVIDRLEISPVSADRNNGAASTSPFFSGDVESPIQRFLNMRDTRDLRIGDVSILLEDYKRLAAELSELKAGSR